MSKYLHKKKTQFKEKKKYYVDEIYRLNSTPHEIALGFSIGAFIAILPTPGFSVLIGVLIAILYKKINKYALFGALALFNPIMMIPLYTLSYKIGDLFLSTQPITTFEIIFLNTVLTYTKRYLLGAVIVASIGSTISYFIVKYLAKDYYKNLNKSKE